ncbi:MAG: hypothetical protein H7843_02375 [Nitrospirota bacterium]
MKTFSLVLLVFAVFLYVPALRADPPPPNFAEIHAKIAEFKELLARQTNKDIITKALEIDEKSKEAFTRGNHALSFKLITEGIALLKAGVSPPSPALAPAPDETPLGGTGSPSRYDSPFGIFGPYEYWAAPLSDKLASRDVISKEEINKLLADLGVAWVQEMAFELKNLPGNVNIYTRVGSSPHIPPPDINYDHYLPALKKQISLLKNRVKYYEIDTEPLGEHSSWADHANKYAQFLRKSYSVIKAECPDCSVVLGGLPGADTNASTGDLNSRFLRDILNHNAGKYFDVLEIKQHIHSLEDYRVIKTRLDVYRKILQSYGVNVDKMPVFLETAMYNGSPSRPSEQLTLPPQTETDQAIGLVKTYVYAISIGFNKIFWNGVMELYKFAGNPNDPFNYYGLVSNWKNSGKSHKKLAYYSYKKMIETLDGSDWKKTEVVMDSDGVFVCKFLKSGRRIWVVWSDDKNAAKTITLKLDPTSKVKITTSIPAKALTGTQVRNYTSAFVPSAAATDESGDLTIKPDTAPVYIEEDR